MNSKKIASYIAILALILGAFALYKPLVHASSNDVTGWWWSSNTGWISLNCLDGGVGGAKVCTDSSYGVKMIPGGDLQGYAWSDNIGWIQFGGLVGFPSGDGSTSANAHMDQSTGKLTGWVRATRAMNPGPDVNDLGGWDGWISLDGNKYQMTFDKTTGVSTGGFGWGGDNPTLAGLNLGTGVLGWINDFATYPSPTVLPGPGDIELLPFNQIVAPGNTHPHFSWRSADGTTSFTGCKVFSVDPTGTWGSGTGYDIGDINAGTTYDSYPGGPNTYYGGVQPTLDLQPSTVFASYSIKCDHNKTNQDPSNVATADAMRADVESAIVDFTAPPCIKSTQYPEFSWSTQGSFTGPKCTITETNGGHGGPWGNLTANQTLFGIIPPDINYVNTDVMQFKLTCVDDYSVSHDFVAVNTTKVDDSPNCHFIQNVHKKKIIIWKEK